MPLDVDAIIERMPERQLLWLDTTDSTMWDAQRLAEAGCPAGTIVGAEEQTAGQGRYGRRWHSPPGTGLYFSLVLRPKLPPETMPLVTMALGLAAGEAIAQTTGLTPDLRWPNDVLLNGRKCAGILVQMHGAAVIAGMGLNVNQVEFPEEIAAIATSMRREAGLGQERETLLIALLESIDRHVQLLTASGKEPILRLFTQASSYVLGRRVMVDQGDRVLIGTTAGLDANGFLLLDQEQGGRSVIMTGGVRTLS